MSGVNGAFNLDVAGALNIKTVDATTITSGKEFHLQSSANYLSAIKVGDSSGNTEINSAGNHHETASAIHMNGPAAVAATPYGGLTAKVDTDGNFSEEEVKALREFMHRGGFVMVDDFWGEPHLDDMISEVAKIFPERELVKLNTDHELFHIFFDIDRVAQVPGRMVTWDYGGFLRMDDPSYPPEVYAILDDENRIMMVANYNTDLGDGWEDKNVHNDPENIRQEALKMGTNIIIYSLIQ